MKTRLMPLLCLLPLLALTACNDEVKRGEPPSLGGIAGGIAVSQDRAKNIEDLAEKADKVGIAPKSADSALLKEQVKQLNASLEWSAHEVETAQDDVNKLAKDWQRLKEENDRLWAAADRRNLFLCCALVIGGFIYLGASIAKKGYAPLMLVPAPLVGLGACVVVAGILYSILSFWSGIGKLFSFFGCVTLITVGGYVTPPDPGGSPPPGPSSVGFYNLSPTLAGTISHRSVEESGRPRSAHNPEIAGSNPAAATLSIYNPRPPFGPGSPLRERLGALC
jgi:hypothetical protein